MVWLTCELFNLPPSVKLLAFVFAGSVSSYNFHWLLTPPALETNSVKTLWNIAYRRVHLALFIAGSLLAIYTSFLLLRHWEWLLLTAVLTFLYSAPKIPHPVFSWLRRIAVGKTIYLALSWTHVTAVLPILILDVQPGAAEICFIISRFFFIYAICIFFDRRDIDADRRSGVRSLITILTLRGVNWLFWVSLAIHIVATMLLHQWFPLWIMLLLLLPALPLGYLYQHYRDERSDYLYYFVLDGLMMLSAPLVILAKFAR